MSELIHLSNATERPPQLRREDLKLRFSERAIAEVEALKTHYPEWKACILPVLWIAQREYGGALTGEAIAEVAHRLNRAYPEVQGVATFYSMYNAVHTPGKHKLEVCTCLTCHITNAFRIRDYITEKLGIRNGETTADGLFTLEEVECLNACGRAPVVQVGDQYHGPVDEAYMDRLIEDLRAKSESTVVQMADEIVKIQLRAGEVTV